MPEYLVRLHEPPRGVREARVSCESAARVAQALGVAPHQVLSARPVAEARPRGGRARLDERLFAQELAVLLEAGIPLLEAVQTLREKDGPGAALDTVLGAVREGRTLSAALQDAGFAPLFVALVAASERNGQLAPTLRQHAAYLAWAQALRGRLVAAATYPVLLLAAGYAVVVFLLLYVLPRFAGVFEGLGRDLPGASQALMDLGVAAQAHLGWAIGLAVALPATLVALVRQPEARAWAERGLWRAPVIGAQLRVLALARLYRTLALLLGAGVPALPALALAEGVLAPPLRPALAAAAAAVGGGQRLSQALQSAGLATPVALRMVRVGESSGELATMFERAAAFHDEEISRLAELVTRAVNPVLMLAMGVVIGGIVVLMYLPIFSLMEQVQ